MKDAILGNPELTRKINQRLTLNLIKKYSPISRAELSKKSGLSAPTVSNIIDNLLEARYIREIGLGSSQGGRRPVLLILNDRHYRFIGINITPIKVSVVLTEMNLEILDRYDIPIHSKISADELLDQINAGISHILDQPELFKEQILGIGISSPGQIDAKNGKVIVSYSIPNWRDVPVASIVEEKWGIPTFVEHNVKALAMRELWIGAGSIERNFIAMKIGYGIGAGIAIDGNIFRGAAGNSGELGHTKIQVDGPLCTCGSRGCYESLADLAALENRLKERIPGFQGNYEEVFRLAKEGNQDALEAIRDTAWHLARGMVNVIHLFNPSLILVGGEVSPFWSFLSPHVMRALEEFTLETLKKVVNVSLIDTGSAAELQGAAAIVFDREFRIPVKS